MATGAAPTRVHAWEPLRWTCGSPALLSILILRAAQPASGAGNPDVGLSGRHGPFPSWSQKQAALDSLLSVFPSGTAARSDGTEACSNTTAITKRPKLHLLPTTSLQELVPSLPPQEQAWRAHPSLLPDVSPSVFKPMVSAQPLQSYSHEQQSTHWRREGTGPLCAAPGKQHPHNGARQMV